MGVQAEGAAGAGDEPPLLADHQFRAALDAMLDHVAIGRAIRGPDGTIEDFLLLYMNTQSIDGAGRQGHDMVGRRVLELYPNWPGSGLLDAFANVVETGEPFEVDRVRYEDVAADGTVIAGHWSISVVRFGDGYIAASRDVSHLVAAEQVQREAELEAERSRFAVELLRRAALPSSLPAVDGVSLAARYEPASPDQPVGGDWYDAFELPGGRLGLVIADVAGHGREAAAHMVQVRHVIRSLALDRGEPGDVLGRAARVLGQLGEQPLFATCCYAVVHPSAGQLTWASAGHLAPVLVRSGAPAAQLRGAVAPPLGVDPAALAPSHVVPVGPGDRMVLFTDGLVERRGEDLDRSLGDLAAWVDERTDLSIPALADALVARTPGRADDVAVLCVGIER